MTRLNFACTLLFSLVLASSCDRWPAPLEALEIKSQGEIPWDQKGPCTIIWRGDSLPGKIKYRGGMSVGYPKKSYALDLNLKTSLLGLPADDDWILNASYIDKTFIRHKLSYDLFRQMSVQNLASECSYFLLRENGTDKGLYVLMEEVDASMIGLNKLDSMAMLFKDPSIFYEERLPKVQDSTNYYQQKFPKIQQADKAWYLDQFRAFMFQTDDQSFVQGIDQWVDLRNVIDWHLILLLSNNGDGIMKNWYLYKLDASTPFRFAIWDYDHSFGRDGDGEYNMMERPIKCKRSVLLRRLMETDAQGYNQRLNQRYQQLRKKGIFSKENLLAKIEENRFTIIDAVAANVALWPDDGPGYWDKKSHREEVAIMEQFIELRLTQLDERFGWTE